MEFLKITGTYYVNELCDNKYYVFYIKLRDLNNIYFIIILNNIYQITNKKSNKSIYTEILDKRGYKKDKKMLKKKDIKEINKKIELYNMLFNMDDFEVTKYNLNITFINYFMTSLIINMYKNKLYLNNYNKILNVIKSKLSIYIYDIINIIDKCINNISYYKNEKLFWELLINEAEKYKKSNKFIYTSIKNIFIKYNIGNTSIYIIRKILSDFYNILNNKNILNNIYRFINNNDNLNIISTVFYTNKIIYINNHISKNDPISNFAKNTEINIYNTKNTDYIDDILSNFMKYYICIM